MDKLKEDVSAISKDVAVINVKFETVRTKEELLKDGVRLAYLHT